MTAPGPHRIQLSRAKGWRMPANAVKVDRTTRWGNPFDFRRAEYCWAALSLGCRGDAAGRQEASVRAFRGWIDPPHGRQTLSMTEQPKMVGPGGEVPLGPPITAGASPSREEIRKALRGKNLACWCKPGSPCHADVLLEIANR
ncbi:DUF4326 domain-containing protein [Reyranella sp.]|uniref:DUF4326 domain-containing protein n=1 Tax=Reyranella sp. TaxID=1929291 RepID=UPI003C7C08AE